MYRFYYCKPRIENWLYTFGSVLHLNVASSSNRATPRPTKDPPGGHPSESVRVFWGKNCNCGFCFQYSKKLFSLLKEMVLGFATVVVRCWEMLTNVVQKEFGNLLSLATSVGGSLIGKPDTLIWALDRKSFHFWLYQRFRVRQLFWDATQLL